MISYVENVLALICYYIITPCSLIQKHILEAIYVSILIILYLALKFLIYTSCHILFTFFKTTYAQTILTLNVLQAKQE